MLEDQGRNDAEIVALSIDDRKHLDHHVIDRYGLLNPSGRGWPHPTVVIDKTGVVRWKFTEVNYKIRPTNAMILEALGKVG